MEFDFRTGEPDDGKIFYRCDGSTLNSVEGGSIFVTSRSQIGHQVIRTPSFRRGDIVQLNSGGPTMVVDEVEDEAGSVLVCKWYEGHERQVKRFFVDGLHHVPITAAAGG